MSERSGEREFKETGENREAELVDILPMPKTAIETKQLIVDELIKRGYINTEADIGYNFFFRVFNKGLVPRVLREGTDRSNASLVHYEREKLKSQNLEPRDIVYSAILSNLIQGSFFRDGKPTPEMAIAVYDASKLEGVRGIPHADKPKEGFSFKDTLLFVISS